MSADGSASPAPGTYRTIQREVEHEPDKIKGSRHIARVARVTSLAEVEAVLDVARAAHPEAGHHAYAFRLRQPTVTSRSSDDGEPTGSAGAPLLARLEGADLLDVVVVVSRIFGGTKLGVGGLVRAYGGAATEALELAGECSVVPRVRLRLEHGYEESGAVAGVLHAFDLTPERADYADVVRLELEVEEHRRGELERELAEATAGRARTAPIQAPPPG